MKSIDIIKLMTICIAFSACNSLNMISNAQKERTNFEGKVTYELQYLPKSNNISKEQANSVFGTEQTYIISGNKYKNRMNGSLGMTQYYLGNDTLFMLTNMSDELLWVDATYINEKVLSTEIKKDAEIINGLSCDLLTIKSTKGTLKYFYNTKYQIDPNTFTNHRVGFWDICISMTNSLMLKSILDTDEEYIELTAFDIQKIKIDQSEFELPNLKRKEFPINKKK